MPPKMHRAVVDTHSNALQGLIAGVLIILVTAGVAISALDGIDNPNPEHIRDPNKFGDVFLSWFVWKEPLVVLAVIVPLAIALQVAVHGIRAEQDSIMEQTIPGVRIRDHQIKRVRFFSRTAVFSAALITVFTVSTTLAELFGFEGKPDVSLAITVALCGGVTAILCLDAARVATTQDLEKRLSQVIEVHRMRKKHLTSLKRDLPPQKRLWFSSCIALVILTVPPVYIFRYSGDSAGPESNLPEWAAKITVVIVLVLFFSCWLGLWFLLLSLLTLFNAYVPENSIFLNIILLSLVALLTAQAILFPVRAWDDEWTVFVYAWTVLPAVAFASAAIARVQGARRASSWITRYTFGFPGLFRLWNARIVARFVLASHNKVSWLQEVLRESTAAQEPSEGSERQGFYHRLSRFLVGGVRRRG